MLKPKQSEAPRPKKPWNQLSSKKASEIRTKRAKFRKEHDPRYKKFGEWMRALRASLEMSQEEFAKVMGVSYMTIRRWELGWGHFPKEEHRIKLRDISSNLKGFKPWDMTWKRGKENGNNPTV